MPRVPSISVSKVDFLSLFFLLTSLTCHSMGFADWHETTRNGTTFCDPGDGVEITLVDGAIFKYVRRWYFYKDHIIGTGIANERGASGNSAQIFL